MRQPTIDWNADVSLPVSGLTPQARHSSASGATSAVRGRGALSVAYVELLRHCGPLSDYEAAAALGRAVSSLNSTRGGLGSRIVPSGQYELTPWGSRRVRWMVAE